MALEPAPPPIYWRLHLSSPPEAVYDLLATADGRARFWAESAEAVRADAGGDGVPENGVPFVGAPTRGAPTKGENIHFRFPGGQTWTGAVLAAERPTLFRLVYYGGSTTTFRLASDGSGGTDLELSDEGVPEADRCEVQAGWVSVLMALKAAADFGADLRNHDPQRTWDQGYADN